MILSQLCLPGQPYGPRFIIIALFVFIRKAVRAAFILIALFVFTRKAVRAAFILIPLLGLQFVLYPVQPHRLSRWHHPYHLVTAFVTSSQVRQPL